MSFIGEAIAHFLLELILYPILYGFGVFTLKVLTLGRAQILGLFDTHHEGKMRWNQFFYHSLGQRYWTAESAMLVGMISSFSLAGAAYFLFPH